MSLNEVILEVAEYIALCKERDALQAKATSLEEEIERLKEYITYLKLGGDFEFWQWKDKDQEQNDYC